MFKDMKMYHKFENKEFSYFRQRTVILLWSVTIFEQLKCVNKNPTPTFKHYYKPFGDCT